MITPGDKVRHRITGFAGVAVMRALWICGYVQIGVQGETLNNGVPVELQYWSEAELELAAPAPKKAQMASRRPRA